MAIQALEGPVLSEGLADIQMAWLLRTPLRHGRAEQSLLPATREEDVREVASRGPRRLRLCGEAQPLHHPHRAPGRRTRQHRALLRDDGRSRPEARRRARPAAAAYEVR